eukprot:TRINITY_DN33628_c0_g1_i1.p1 TRINITY_DN33628_c0_g1~~TRINITY_DN33628_c0_g1_i1.p1  ORF type:complete len:110 (-),score=4.18 TRINITY_DN33628_c0_g1_i1:70-399(-)
MDWHIRSFALFPACDGSGTHGHNTRLAAARHSKQLRDQFSNCRLDILRRSIFSLVKVWNLLPSDVICKTTVSSFQHALTNIAKDLCKRGVPSWRLHFSPRSPVHELLMI